METCNYCGMVHHPMPVYELIDRINQDHKPRMIHVCLYKFDKENNLIESDCVERAISEGYKFRPDLTPKR